MEVSLASGESTLVQARTMALVNLASADAGIAAWDAKYEHDFWRPIEAIRRADEDGNEATVISSTICKWMRCTADNLACTAHRQDKKVVTNCQC